MTECIAADMGILQLQGVGAEPDTDARGIVPCAIVIVTRLCIKFLATEQEVGMVVRAILFVLEHLASRQEHQPFGDM